MKSSRSQPETAPWSEDRILLNDVARGDKVAMRQLYMRFHDPLYSFIRMRCDDDALAQDVVQEAMMAVWRQAEKFSGQSAVKTWIFAIGRNKLVDRIRRSSQLSFTDEVPEVMDDSPDAETVMQSAQDASRVHKCLDKLKKVQLAVVRLAFFDGLTYDEIAEVEGIPQGTVKTRIFHAKKVLMHCLGKPT